MSWLGDIVRVFHYNCEACGEDHLIQAKTSEHSAWRESLDRAVCDTCEAVGKLKFRGFSNVSAVEGGVPTPPPIRMEFDQNGRKAVKIGSTHISKTKLHYMETGRIEPQYTPEYEEKLRRDEEKNEYLLKTETNRRRAAVSRALPSLAR